MDFGGVATASVAGLSSKLWFCWIFLLITPQISHHRSLLIFPGDIGIYLLGLVSKAWFRPSVLYSFHVILPSSVWTSCFHMPFIHGQDFSRYDRVVSWRLFPLFPFPPWTPLGASHLHSFLSRRNSSWICLTFCLSLEDLAVASGGACSTLNIITIRRFLSFHVMAWQQINFCFPTSPFLFPCWSS